MFVRTYVVHGFVESLQICVRSQSSVPSLYGRHEALNFPYKEGIEL